MKKFAVIPTYGRPCLSDCIAAILPQVDEILIIGHNVMPSGLPDNCYVIPYFVEEPPNISTMWNLGIKSAHQNCLVAILNDDAIVPPDWFEKVSTAMAETGSVVGCMSDVAKIHHQTFNSPHLPRMEGYAFILDTSHGIMLDEQFHWWWGDTDLDWQARWAGGTVIVPGTIEHRYPNGTTTGILAEIAGQDRERFIQKWGSAPW